MSSKLADSLVERALEKLGLTERPNADIEGLQTIYSAWCRGVPFDNVMKLIHLQTNNPSTFPGTTPEDFFRNWLLHGTGGTCWSGNGALHALLIALGFRAYRGVATMLVAPNVPPNHGTVIVEFDSKSYWLDASILHDSLLLLDEQTPPKSVHPAWGVGLQKCDGHWHILWRPLNKLEGLECRLDYFPADLEEFQTRFEQTRLWSPFNYELTVRVLRGDTVDGIALGQRIQIDSAGRISHSKLNQSTRADLLLELGFSVEIVSKLQPDRPTPPPPWTETARQASSTA